VTALEGGGSAGRAAAGAVRIGNAIGAAFTNRRRARTDRSTSRADRRASSLPAFDRVRGVSAALAYSAGGHRRLGGIALLYRGYRLRPHAKAVKRLLPNFRDAQVMD
jgi:cardiolipin synthase